MNVEIVLNHPKKKTFRNIIFQGFLNVPYPTLYFSYGLSLRIGSLLSESEVHSSWLDLSLTLDLEK